MIKANNTTSNIINENIIFKFSSNEEISYKNATCFKKTLILMPCSDAQGNNIDINLKEINLEPFSRGYTTSKFGLAILNYKIIDEKSIEFYFMPMHSGKINANEIICGLKIKK